MTGAGKIDVPKDELDFVVAVRPFAGIDTALNYIPLLGRSVAAIKNSFLVASFNITGSDRQSHDHAGSAGHARRNGFGACWGFRKT